MPAVEGQIFKNAHGIKTIVARAPDGHLRVYELAKYLGKATTKVPPAAKIFVGSAAAAVGLAALGVYLYKKCKKPSAG